MATVFPKDDKEFSRWLAQRLKPEQPLLPGNELYQPLYDSDPNDPITLIQRDIEFNEVESLNYLSGFRGSGKTTELYRLRKQLKDVGHYVAYANALDYFPPSEPIEISNFLILLAGSLSDSVKDDLQLDIVHENWWTRFVNFLTKTNVKLDGMDYKDQATGINLKASLKNDPSFRQRLRDKLSQRFGELRNEVQLFVADVVKKIRTKSGNSQQSIAFIFDNLEQLRDTLGDDMPVADSVTALMANHRVDLQLHSVHCIYTVPPWLKFKLPGPTSAARIIYNVKLWQNTPNRDVIPSGLKMLRELVEKRFTNKGLQRFFGKHEHEKRVEKLIHASGGHFRDLILLLRECVLRAQSFPLNDTIIDAAIQNLRNSFLPIPIRHAEWLQQIAQSSDCVLSDTSAENVKLLTHFIDTHLVMIHRNSTDWYDVHPIIRDEVEKIVKNHPRGDQSKSS